MTSPDEPRRPEPAASGPPQPTPSESGPPEPTPAEQPAPEQPTAQQPAAQQPPYAYPYPFAPVPRPPKVPWIAPQRKGAVIAIAIAAALVFLGAGVGIGAAAFGGSDRHGPVRIERPRYGEGPLPGYPGIPKGPRHHQLPPSTPTPSPTAS